MAYQELPTSIYFIVGGLVVFHSLALIYWVISALRAPDKLKGAHGAAALSRSINSKKLG